MRFWDWAVKGSLIQETLRPWVNSDCWAHSELPIPCIRPALLWSSPARGRSRWYKHLDVVLLSCSTIVIHNRTQVCGQSSSAQWGSKTLPAFLRTPFHETICLESSITVEEGRWPWIVYLEQSECVIMIDNLKNPLFTQNLAFEFDKDKEWANFVPGNFKASPAPPQLWDGHLDTFLAPPVSPLAGEAFISSGTIKYHI